MEKYICIHAHCYQPPRENPWLDEVELQDGAYPYHDWNERITEECYAPNTASRILDEQGRIIDIANLYSKISFNFGPTLLSWLERHRPDIYGAILEADVMSRERYSGHGSAIAQVYNHMIMPLASLRDKRTQVRWGLRDFHRRFGREAEGMWLPETAVDIESLEVLAEEGVRYTILAPRQARRIRLAGEDEWKDVSEDRLDPTIPCLCRLPSGREIALFFYDGPIARDIAFGGLLSNGGAFAERLLGAFPPERSGAALVHVATDGETYGHHVQGGDMALAYCLHHVESTGAAALTNYGEHLERYPPEREVEIFERSSWSCVHGVERWRSGCGCSTGAHPDWTQDWRAPLREAMDWLGDRLARFYEEEGAVFFRDIWAVRDDYVELFHDRSGETVDLFLGKRGKRDLSTPEKARALKLLEVQKNAQLIYTSCGWFFDDVSGIETVQVLRYAAQAIQYVGELEGTSLEKGFMELLRKAPGNIEGNGEEVYRSSVEPAKTDHRRVGAHYGISSLFEDYPEECRIYCYTFRREESERREAGRIKLVTGRIQVISELTRDEKALTYVVLHLGDQNIHCGVRRYVGATSFEEMRDEIGGAFDKGDVTGVIRLIDRHFRSRTYTLWHLFRDEQRKILAEILRLTYEEIESLYRQIYDTNYPLLNFMTSMKVPLPRPLMVAAEYIANRDLRSILESTAPDEEKLRMTIEDIRRWSLKVDDEMARYLSSIRIAELMEEFRDHPERSGAAISACRIIDLLGRIAVKPNLWKAQNIFFSIARERYRSNLERAEDGDREAREWVETFRSLEPCLQVRIE